jgi:hypothetical protein
VHHHGVFRKNPQVGRSKIALSVALKFRFQSVYVTLAHCEAWASQKSAVSIPDDGPSLMPG